MSDHKWNGRQCDYCAVLWHEAEANDPCPLAPEATGWQPIATAPKDGTPIYAGRVGEARLTFYSQRSQAWCRLGTQQETQWEPTHWQPLPTPPADGEENRDD